jgi:hypothetical protein
VFAMNAITRITNIARSPGDPKVLSKGPSSLGSPDRLARGLGWFSIGLGLAELFASRPLARALGMEGGEWLLRGYGAREITAGILSLSVNPMPGITSRVAGDALDIATLLAADRYENPKRENVRVALLAVIGVTLLDIVCTAGLQARHGRGRAEPRTYRDRSGFPQGLSQARGAAR